jgi:hypothetical protein
MIAVEVVGQHVVGLSDVGFAAIAAVQQQRLSSVKFKIVSRLRNDPVLKHPWWLHLHSDAADRLHSGC